MFGLKAQNPHHPVPLYSNSTAYSDSYNGTAKQDRTSLCSVTSLTAPPLPVKFLMKATEL